MYTCDESQLLVTATVVTVTQEVTRDTAIVLPPHCRLLSPGKFNPLECRGRAYSATSNDMKLVQWPLMGWLLHCW